MNVCIESPGSENFSLARDDFGTWPDDDADVRLDIRIASLADSGDTTRLDADVGFDNAPMIENERVRNDGVDGALALAQLALAHAVADDLAAAEFHLLAIGRMVALDLDDDVRVRQPHAIAGS